MNDYLMLAPAERDDVLAGMTKSGLDPQALSRWIAGEADQGRALRLVDLLRPHLAGLAEQEILGLMDTLAARMPRVAHRLAAAAAAADVRHSVGLAERKMSAEHKRDRDPVVAFYRGERPDGAGRAILDVLSWDDRALEGVHDYIQWLFPNSAPSPVNPSAPLVTPQTIADFAADEGLRQRLLRSFDRMLLFYGLERVETEGCTEVRPGANFEARKANWLTPDNHNHLRITRILTALQLLGLPRQSLALGECLRRIYDSEGPACITEKTVDFWMKASGARR